MPLVTWEQANAWRLTQHYLHQPADSAQMLDVVSAIGGLQAQVMSAAELALSARVKDISPDHVQNGLWQDRRLVKSWYMRGTLHILTATNLPVYVGAMSTHGGYEGKKWQEYFSPKPRPIASNLRCSTRNSLR